MSGLAGQTSFYPPESAPDPLLCWLWLAHVMGPGSVHAGRVLDAFGGAQEAWEARASAEFELAAGPAAAKRAVQLDPEQYHGLVMRCDALGVRILPFDDPDYPLAFSRIPDMPLVLYCTGDPCWLNEPGTVGIVGSRKPTEYGLNAAADIGGRRAQAGAIIVSGLADGLDSAGHKAAVKNGCPTIGILGVAIDRTYPAEAREKSGTMSTVAHAERYGRPVYAVPGSIYSPNSAGTNALLRDGRARAVCSAADLMEPLGLHGAKPAPEAQARRPEPVSDTERRVLACIGPKPVGMEELCVNTGLPTAVLLSTLMKLELSGRVYRQPGQRYILR